jgi:hypothetical protein
MNVLERARASGLCPPSLFCDEPKEDAFEAAIAKILDANGTFSVRVATFLMFLRGLTFFTTAWPAFQN